VIKDISEYIYFKTSMHLGSSELFFIMVAESIDIFLYLFRHVALVGCIIHVYLAM